MPSKNKKTIQTTLKPTNNDSEWKTIGHAKRSVQPKELTQESQGHKKADTKSTPPRPIEHSTLLQTPFPASSKLLTYENLDTEFQLIAAINALNSSKTITQDKMDFLEPPKKKPSQ
jgi:hypothetical protein